MDFMRGRTVTHERETSVHQGDNFFSGRVISRNSSAGCSSRIFYNRSAEGVPFKWEMQPGTPRDPPREEIIPALSPPPAMLSLGLRKPRGDMEETKTSKRSRLRFWKLIEKNKRKKKSQRGSEGNSFINIDNNEPCTSERSEFYSSDGDFMASSPRISSSSSSLSSSNGHSRRLSRIENPSRGSTRDPHGCFPWIFNAVLASVARRNI